MHFFFVEGYQCEIDLFQNKIQYRLEFILFETPTSSTLYFNTFICYISYYFFFQIKF